MKVVRSLLLVASLWACQVEARVMLTGEVVAKNAESFYAPRVTGWQIQIQWMLPEGQIAKPGDLVVLFDRASLDSQIEMAQSQLQKSREVLQLTEVEGKQRVMEAEFAYQKALLELEKSQIEADIGSEFVSRYEHEKATLNRQRAQQAVEKAARQLKTQKENADTERKKQQTQIKKNEFELNELQRKSLLTAVKTKTGGPIIYASHPWNGSKLTSGTSVQATWKVAEIASSENMQVKAWLNEVDEGRLKVGSAVSIAIDALPDKVLKGVVSRINPQAEERAAWGNAAYFEVLIDLADARQSGLIPGMSVLVEED